MTNNIAVNITHTVDFISQRAKAVFIALASFSDKEDTCFPSINKIVKRSGLSESTVHRAIADLIVMELIIKTSNYRDNDGCTSNIYTLINPLCDNYSEVTPAPSQSDRGEGVSLTPPIEFVNNINLNNLTFYSKTDTREAEKTENSNDEITANQVIDNCELPYIRANYGEDFANILKNTVQRLYYSDIHSTSPPFPA